ncbi:hypothetical protein TUBRATIS_25010 [Tubulinosema ratisbonensis]|uniref:Uncharacterized protein n=1 Tax=Tubulinosema ratisbonensis TaxID=291195 RepID=A0A437AIS1_9MICR|nr:hypothetical protein TUBRATIS_25010 [Tubulinosema ratisbonensis]
MDFRYCKIWSMEKLNISFRFFFEDDKNSIFLDIFPEIYLFVDKFERNIRSLHVNLIQYDIFLNLIAFKFAYLKAMIKRIINQENQNPRWIITDSKPLMSYIFEMKCTFAIFAFNLLRNPKYHKLLIFRALVIFLKLKDSEVLNFTEFLDQVFLPIPDDLTFLNNLIITKHSIDFSKDKKSIIICGIKSFRDPKIYIFFKDCTDKLIRQYDKDYRNYLTSSKYKSPCQFTTIKSLTEKLKKYFE